MQIKREIKVKIIQSLYKGKVILLYGPRRVGKTTLVKEILKEEGGSRYLLCDEPYIREALTNKSSDELKRFIGNEKIVVIDEAQRVENIGLTLKLLVDNFPEMQVIATGSSSFDLSNKINEPLTGRNIEFHLFPFSLGELRATIGDFEVKRRMQEFLNFGLYPEVFLAETYQEKKDLVKKLATDQLYKDIFQYQEVRKPQVLEGMLRFLSLSTGQEVNYSKIGTQIEISKETVMWYLRLMEQAFVLFKLGPFFKNKLKEISRLNKFYFYDVGIRNGIIDSFELDINLRIDKGYLWENFVVSEFAKEIYYKKISGQKYFWRAKTGLEIDFLLDKAIFFQAYEIKWSKEKIANLDKITDNFDNKIDLKIVNQDNFFEVLDSLK